jgi:hypothetical protein
MTACADQGKTLGVTAMYPFSVEPPLPPGGAVKTRWPRPKSFGHSRPAGDSIALEPPL